MVKMVKNGPKTGKNGKFRSEKGLCGLEMHFCEKKSLPKLAKSLRKKVSRKKKLKFMRRRYFDFISSNAALTCVVKSLSACLKPRGSDFARVPFPATFLFRERSVLF